MHSHLHYKPKPPTLLYFALLPSSDTKAMKLSLRVCERCCSTLSNVKGQAVEDQ